MDIRTSYFERERNTDNDLVNIICYDVVRRVINRKYDVIFVSITQLIVTL